MKLNFFLLFIELVSTFSLMSSCNKVSGGNAPSTIVSLSISPTSLIVPKNISTSLQVVSVTSGVGSSVVTSQASCASTNSAVGVNSAGVVSNNYTGTVPLALNITCTYLGQSVTIPVTILPAVLQNLIITKSALSMTPNQTQSVQVYGNFIDAANYVFALDMTNYVAWASSAAAVSSASVGTITSGSSLGSATLTASLASQTATATVTVSNSATNTSTPVGVGLLGTYYDFITGAPWSASTIGDPFETLKGARIDSQVYFNWSTGTNNLGQVAYFGIKWTGKIYIPTTGAYTFYTTTDDGVRLWINDVVGTPVIDNWTLHGSTQNTSSAITLTGGQFYDIRMDYFENAGYSQAELRWSSATITQQLIPQVNLFPQ